VNATWRVWIAPIAVAILATALWFLAPYVSPTANLDWAYLGWGLSGSLSLVAANSYRSRRDPAVLFMAVGSGAFAIEWFVYALSRTGAGANGWLVSIGLYAIVLAPLALAACLFFTVPWRDRRGRPPLRVRTVVLAVGLPLVTAAAAVAAEDAAGPGQTQIRVLTGITVAIALVAASRSIARGGWHAWLGGGSLALIMSGAGAWLVFGSTLATSSGRGGLTWFTYMPSAAVGCILIGVLAAQRADTSRMRRATDRATEVMEGRAEIASIVAHDVRGPAGTIRSVASSLRSSYERLGDAERLEFVGMIEQESLRVLRVADQMSLGLKADAATIPYTFTLRDVEGPVLQGLHEAEIGAREVHVEADSDVLAPVDGRWIAEAVRQGVDNALKFSPDDDPIELRVRSDGDLATIEIEDRGPGVPPEMRESVFEKFSRWRPRGYEDVSGSGLGLFIVRSIARAHGGDASLTSGNGAGTILAIHLPTEAPGDG
jgi:signal transduction histidine kinase